MINWLVNLLIAGWNNLEIELDILGNHIRLGIAALVRWGIWIGIISLSLTVVAIIGHGIQNLALWYFAWPNYGPVVWTRSLIAVAGLALTGYFIFVAWVGRMLSATTTALFAIVPGGRDPASEDLRREISHAFSAFALPAAAIGVAFCFLVISPTWGAWLLPILLLWQAALYATRGWGVLRTAISLGMIGLILVIALYSIWPATTGTLVDSLDDNSMNQRLSGPTRPAATTPPPAVQAPPPAPTQPAPQQTVVARGPQVTRVVFWVRNVTPEPLYFYGENPLNGLPAMYGPFRSTRSWEQIALVGSRFWVKDKDVKTIRQIRVTPEKVLVLAGDGDDAQILESYDLPPEGKVIVTDIFRGGNPA